MHVELESIEALRAHVERHGELQGVVLHGLDLGEVEELLMGVPARGAVFLGCSMGREATDHVLDTGGLVFPRLEHLPYRCYRTTLYTVDELMEGYRPGQPDSFEMTCDGRIWAWYRRHRDQRGAKLPVLEAMAQRLHDHAMDDAMAELLARPGPGDGAFGRRRVVAVMGGHALARTDPAWVEVVHLGRRLAREGFVVATGGGPGAMEAAHLGAWLAPAPDDALAAACAELQQAATYRDPGWFETALAVRARWPQGAAVDSLAVPTWFYGHEPTNLFATHVAKYFSNSLREDGLLAIATHGVVYAPGSAGTVQEIFMDAAQNHYGTFQLVSPMAFLGRTFWTHDRPVAELLSRLAGARQYADMIGFVDDAAAAVAFLHEHPPVLYRD
ncbi:MAG: hypothetical protein H6742_04030 [Alphaproteobacteria bacterium]|nr:hypothetical protein [Alphaproteobacteria bacterium]